MDDSILNGVLDKTASAVEMQEAVEEMIDDAEYLEVERKKEARKKNLYKAGLFVAIIVIIILLLQSCTGTMKLKNNTKMPELENSALMKQEVSTEVYECPRIEIPVIQNFIVSKSFPYKDLFNPEANKGNYYLQYSFTVVGEDEPFYESKLVEGGYKFSANIGELLEIGEYEVRVDTNTFEEKTLEPKSGDSHVIKITVTE